MYLELQNLLIELAILNDNSEQQRYPSFGIQRSSLSNLACRRDIVSQAFASDLIILETITCGNSLRASHSYTAAYASLDFPFASKSASNAVTSVTVTKHRTYNCVLSRPTIYQLINENHVFAKRRSRFLRPLFRG